MGAVQNKDTKEIFKEVTVLTILLSYCPLDSANNQKISNGIQLYSNHVYESLRKTFPTDEIIYVNFENFKDVRGLKGISHFFGISANFNRIVSSVKPDAACLLSVNEHSLLRRSIRDLRHKRNLRRSFDDPHDGFVSELEESNNADWILGIGSWAVFQSYLKAGYPANRILVTGYPYWQTTANHVHSRRNYKILMYPGYICTRKGADYIEEILNFLERNFPEFKLKLVGFFSYSAWREKVSELKLRFPHNFEFVEGRIQYGSSTWLELANDVAFAIFPTHEEGLAGCALDVINLGVPLVHSSKTGLEYQHHHLTGVDFENDKWQKGLAEIIRGGEALWQDIAKKQLDASFHLNQNYSPISRAIDRIPRGRIWPNVEFRDLQSLSFLSNDTLEYDYALTYGNQADIALDYLGNSLTLDENVLMSVMMLEKYANFNSINVPNSKQVLKRSKNHHEMKEQNNRIQITVREYLPASNWPTNTFRYLLIREKLFTLFDRFFYKIRRVSNIMKLKFTKEFKKILKIRLPDLPIGKSK